MDYGKEKDANKAGKVPPDKSNKYVVRMFSVVTADVYCEVEYDIFQHLGKYYESNKLIKEQLQMELFQTDKFYIFAKREKTLWWNRHTSEFSIKAGWDLSSVDDIECIGITHGIVGIISLPNVYEPHLVVIKEATPVGVLYPPHLVYKIKSICILSVDEPDTALTACTRHTSKICNLSGNQSPIVNVSTQRTISNDLTTTSARSKLFEGNQLMNKTWGAVKSAGNTIKNTTQHAAVLASNQVKSTVGIRNPSRLEKRITEELHKIFDETNSFYFCYDFDITNNLQRHLQSDSEEEQTSDDRFFWNMYMIKDIMQLNDKSWILPIIQGFAQVEPCVIENECFTLAVVSRRSRYRAGTRYKRRGVDEHGNCANYVETEQILSFRHHQLSFTQVRGSVPIYWSQPGYKYRPPPQLNRNEDETQEAFELHFTKELNIYNGVCIVNLVEQSGKEKLIGDSYAKHVLKYNNERLVYVTFDFHNYCRGMRFENVSVLVEALAPEAGAMGFHWRDQRGVICNQKSVFRINCMDCLDRTNVVQTALGKAVLESQLVKLGLSPPYTPIPEQLKSPFMVIWANNGDIISRQYAGTNALKGDYTRTGERKISGMMKDGMNSANRYYLARFKDSYRQATIDMMLGNQVASESLNVLGGQAASDDSDVAEDAEHAKLIVEDCRRLLLGSEQYPVGAWGLIDADPGSCDINETEIDTVLLLTDNCYIVAEYDSHLDKIVRFEKVPLENITLIELGIHQQTKIFPSSSTSALCFRINYKVDNSEGYFHMFRSANVRFFNNMAYIIKTPEEFAESLQSILEMFRIAIETAGYTDIKFITDGVLSRRKSKNPLLEVPKGMPRNLSESQLVQISSKAFTNMAGQFTKLGQSLNPNKNKTKVSYVNRHLNNTVDKCVEAKEKPVFLIGADDRSLNSTSDSDSEENKSSIHKHELESDVDLAISAVAKVNFNNENNFLPSVGIVMGKASGTDAKVLMPGSPLYLKHKLVDKDNCAKHCEDVASISISSVATHVALPTGLLENAIPVRPITPSHDVQGDIANNVENDNSLLIPVNVSSTQVSRSSSPKDLLYNNDSCRFPQLRCVKSPLTKIAKGVQNIDMNLGPRKIVTKTGVLLPVSTSTESTLAEGSIDNKVQLVNMWSEADCKTKLIAL